MEDADVNAGFDAVRAETATPLPDALADLVRQATLAANGHNTQPWLFQPIRGPVLIKPDFARATPVVDPDHHHLYASLGCAAENLSLAARARGLSGEVGSQRSRTALDVTLDARRRPTSPPLASEAIPARRSTRSDYDGRPAPAA